MTRVRYTPLDPKYTMDFTPYQNGHRWRADCLHPTRPSIMGCRHIISKTGLTKLEARKALMLEREKIISRG